MKQIVIAVLMMTVATTASAGNCDKFFLNIFCKSTWDGVAKAKGKADKYSEKQFYKFLDFLAHNKMAK